MPTTSQSRLSKPLRCELPCQWFRPCLLHSRCWCSRPLRSRSHSHIHSHSYRYRHSRHRCSPLQPHQSNRNSSNSNSNSKRRPIMARLPCSPDAQSEAPRQQRVIRSVVMAPLDTCTQLKPTNHQWPRARNNSFSSPSLPMPNTINPSSPSSSPNSNSPSSSNPSSSSPRNSTTRRRSAPLRPRRRRCRTASCNNHTDHRWHRWRPQRLRHPPLGSSPKGRPNRALLAVRRPRPLNSTSGPSQDRSIQRREDRPALDYRLHTLGLPTSI